MPANNPSVGETWEMTDPTTDQPALAVITDVSPTSIHLMSRQQRRLVFPFRSFRHIWRFVQAAPEQSCAFADCGNKGYLRVHDLGQWVWVCRQHIPAHSRPLLPTDNNLDNWSSNGANEERCPSCNAEVSSKGSSVREVEGHQLYRCGSCDTLWVQETASENVEDLYAWGKEVVERTASILESFGHRAQAFLGRTIWQALIETLGTTIESIADVPVRMHTGNPLSIILLGNSQINTTRGVPRLGGQPDRQSPGESIPEVGSVWTTSHSKRLFTVEQIRYAKRDGHAGRRIRIEGHTDKDKTFRVWLDEFLQKYQLCESDKAAIEVPCSIGEEWKDSTDKVVKILDIEEGQVVVELDNGEKALIPIHVIRRQYEKVPSRRTALDRLLDDD